MYIKAHIIDVPYHADHEYTYFVPEAYRESIKKGSAISVPFGKGDRARLAVVTDITAEALEDTKPITSVMSSYFSLSEEMLELCKYMKSTTLCTIGEAVKCIIPSALVFKTKETFTICSAESSGTKYDHIYTYIGANPNVSMERLEQIFDDAQAGVKYLTGKRLISKKTYVDEREKTKTETRLSLAIPREEGAKIANGEGSIKLRSKKQCEVIKLLCEFDELSSSEIYEQAETNKSVIEAVEKLKRPFITLFKKNIFKKIFK